MKTKHLLAALLAAPLLSSCWVVGVGAAASVITTEMADNAHTVYLKDTSANQVWHTAKASLANMADEPITIDSDRHAVRANYDGATVLMQVETHSVQEVKLSVAARKYGFYSGELADMVIKRIRMDLDNVESTE